LTRNLHDLESRLTSSFERQLSQRLSKLDEKLAVNDRKTGKQDELIDRIRSYQDKLERKVKEIVEQNVSIKIQVDSLRTKVGLQELQDGSWQNALEARLNEVRAEIAEQVRGYVSHNEAEKET
jgi:hypothetical protein